MCFPFLYNDPDDIIPHILNCCESIDHFAILNGKARYPFIDIRRQDCNSHLPAYIDILCHLTCTRNIGVHKGRHEFHRIIIL